MGVLKAYTTRVGGGPFVTEDGTLGHLLHGMGREFGSTTGRARRCGWFDAVLVRRAVQLNGVTEMAITNLDGLDGLEKIPVCVGYRLKGKILREPLWSRRIGLGADLSTAYLKGGASPRQRPGTGKICLGRPEFIYPRSRKWSVHL